ncbi:Bacterial type II/III secretion system short domain protein [Pseudobythopirellula maris]|uniref:Bacterial type II/III secretion system short domain protein n=1 Tax=Pseudobythopirellula maris TaxID=2527991 RepID=A0A5C5ZGW2_9BACT|nr:secretin N-terminal domain-containing protein [Pseudobythopirellula maris]TWT86572.1 Bacterial type II/III secretion system short domain protein [Pseudobythopirellula maris]
MQARRYTIRRWAPAALAAVLALQATAFGQDIQSFSSDGEIPAGVPPEIRAQIEAARAKARGSKPKPEKKKEEKKSDDAKKEGEDKKEEKKEQKPAGDTVKRPESPPRTPDPREFDARPENGRVRFSFTGQPWPDVLQWLAAVSDLSLDWQQLPNDYLNLTTTRAYTLPEARDLINRHLQARGYALLLSGEVLSVFKLDAIDPSLVPRVTEDELYDRQPHDIVKVSFQLPDEMSVEKAVEDLKQALSKNAKVMPLAASGRVLAIDAVANLRLVSAVLNEERMAAASEETFREFELQYVQASQVIDSIYVVLGLDPQSRPSQMDLRLQQQKMELLKQMQQKGKDVTKMIQKDGPPVYLIYNRQRNSIIANAPGEQMEIIARTIEALDVPVGGGPAGESSTANLFGRTLKPYELKTIDPQSVVDALQQIGDLSPMAELKADNDSKTLFARASQVDHAKIDSMVEELDGTGMRVVVYSLRRLPADAVAGSIERLLAPVEEEKEDDMPFYFYRRNNNKKEKKPQHEMRIDADIDNNRLIVRGTNQQIAEVENLLKMLGEPIGEPRDRGPVRTLGALPPKETAELMRRLREAWPSVGGGVELIIEGEEAIQEQADDQANDDEATEDEAESQTQESGDRVTSLPPSADSVRLAASPFRLLASPVAAAESQGEAKAEQPAVRVSIGPDGSIVLSSADPEALSRLEDLATAVAPEPPRHKVFQLENRSAYYIYSLLEEYYDDELSGDQDYVVDWWGRVKQTGPKDTGVRLSQRRPIQFVYDNTSNTILVKHATAVQLEEIEGLIKSWDTLPPRNAILARRTGTVQLQYSKASALAATLKDVYRDLLSRRDEEFDTEEDKGTGGTSTRYATSIHYEAQGEQRETEPIGASFDGVFSVAADDIANLLVVSAQTEIYDSVVDMIRSLDEAAKPNTTVAVVDAGGVSAEQLQRALAQALGQPWTGGRPEQQAGGGRNNDRGDRNRGRDRGRNRRRNR